MLYLRQTWPAKITGTTVLVILIGNTGTTQAQLYSEGQRALGVESFDFVWQKIHDEYWDPTFNGVDWNAVREELRPRMAYVLTKSEARAVISDMISRLQLSHFAIFPAEIYKELESAQDSVGGDGETGIDVRVIDGHALVTSVVEGSSADRLGVRSGWEIIRINDTNVVARLKRLMAELPETPSKRVRMAGGMINHLNRRVGTTVDITFLDGNQEGVSRSIPFEKPGGCAAAFGRLGEIRVRIETTMLDDGIGYIAFNGFFNPNCVMKAFNDAMHSFADADGVIIDLRGNGGGLGAMAMGMAGWFVPSPRQLGTLRMRDNALKIIVQPRATTYSGPLAILIDGLSGSASEFLAGGLQEIDRACVIGTRSKGEALPGQYTTLPNGDVFLFATADFVSAGEKRLEGVGVVPDITAPHTRESLLAGKDVALEAATDWIRSQR
ncbi:MAG: S41 family peptidase [Planctomycetota bacterium]|jgi:carboxyl-terminal processing protease